MRVVEDRADRLVAWLAPQTEIATGRIEPSLGHNWGMGQGQQEHWTPKQVLLP